MPNETKYIVIRESSFQSIVTEAFTFASIFLVMFLNHLFLDGSVIIDAMLMCCVMIGILSFNSKIKMTSTEAIAYLTKKSDPKFMLVYHVVRKKDGKVISTFTSYDEVIKSLGKYSAISVNELYEIKIGSERIRNVVSNN